MTEAEATTTPRVGIIGAGAAGLMAAVFAAQAGAQTLVLERTKDGGRKILVSGGGRCNILPVQLHDRRFVTDSSENSMRKILRSWPLKEQIAFFESELHLPLVEEEQTAKLFPASQKARDVRDKLIAKACALGAQFRFDTCVNAIAEEGPVWRVSLENAEPLEFDRLIIATGGLSVPNTGSDGSGLSFAEQLGIPLRTTYPALTPVTTDASLFTALSGITLNVRLTAKDAQRRAVAEDAFLFTHRGYSGPAVLDVSHVIARACDEGRRDAQLLVRWTGFGEEEWLSRLQGDGSAHVASVLRKELPDRLANALCEHSGVPAERKIAQLRRSERQTLLDSLCNCSLPWNGHEGYRKAEVTGGGVDLAAVHPVTMESRSRPGLHFCGEVLDAFGPIGGYNFYWAWVTGKAAGLGSAIQRSLTHVLTAILLLVAGFSAFAQPAAYQSRGVRSYLVNYNAIHGDRFLAEFAARRFVLLDEAGSSDIALVRAVNPDMPILRYKDIVALHRWMDEFDEVNLDEYAFLHSSEPSGLQIQLNGDTATMSWLPDRRALDLLGYRVYWMTDSLGIPQRLIDSTVMSLSASARLPKSAVFLCIAAELRDSTALNYGHPVRIATAAKSMMLRPEHIVETRSSAQVDVDILLREVEGLQPDSVFIVADWDRNNQLHVRDERSALQHSGDAWTLSRSLDISGIRTNCGYEFVIEAWRGGVQQRLPDRGRWHTNVNNRLINNTYGFYVMDVGSSTWRKAYIEQILLAFSQQGYSGLFEDDCWYRVANYGVDSWPPEPYENHVWLANLYEMLDSIRVGIAPRPAYFNGLYTEISDSLLLHTEGGMTEGFAYTHWSGLQRGTYWRNQCNRGLAAIHTYGKTWMALGGAPHDDIDGRMYTLASYLLVADSLSMYANATDYQEFAHFPEFDIPLGQALESAHLDVDDLAHEIGGGRLHIREFQRGTVVVNAGSEAAVFASANGRPALTAVGGVTVEGGHVVTSVMSDTLSVGSARIYMNLLPGSTVSSPIIDSIRILPPVVPSDGSTPCRIAVLAHDPSPEAMHSDPALPLHVVVDAGELGGPRNLLLAPMTTGGPRKPVWHEGEFNIPVGAPADSALVPITVYSSTGLLTVDWTMLRISRGDSSNMLLNYSFEIDNNDDGIPDFWRSYVKGFDYDTTGLHAVTGERSVHVRNDSLTEFRGVSVHVEVGQTVPEKLELSGWSKCANVSGDMNNDYSLYADIRYTDGTSLYGRTARFSTGTHDWEYSSTVIDPEKPIDFISLYALFRRHTGEAWFDQVALRPWQEPTAVHESVSLTPQVRIFPNPAQATIHLAFSLDKSSHVAIRCYDILGRLRIIHPSQLYTRGPATATLSLAGLEVGLYYVQVQTGTGSTVHPVIVQ